MNDDFLFLQYWLNNTPKQVKRNKKKIKHHIILNTISKKTYNFDLFLRSWLKSN